MGWGRHCRWQSPADRATAGAVCAVYASRTADAFVDTDAKDAAESACIETGLLAFKVLRRMDAARGEDAHWRPSHGLA